MRNVSIAIDSFEQWRELYRCNDLLQARAVATCIAAMEFDVRLRGKEHVGSSLCQSDGENLSDDFRGPYTVEVPHDHWLDLRAVLDQIIDEQAEFDAMLESRRASRNRVAVVVLSISALAEVIVILRLMDT